VSAKARAPKRRSRGTRFACSCQQERFALTRGGATLFVQTGKRVEEHKPDMARHGAETFLFGTCGGGVALTFNGVSVVGNRDVFMDEAKRIRSLPAPRIDRYASVVAELKEGQRARLDAIESELRQRSGELVTAGVEIGNLLVEAKKLLGHRHFGLFLERMRIDREKAFTAMRIAEVVKATPRFFGTFQKMGQEKTALLMRLPDAKRVEILEDGVPVDGQRVPVTELSYRKFNAVVRSIVGKSSRGRKPKDEGPKPAERAGVPTGIFEAFQHVFDGLKVLERAAKKDWPAEQRVRIGRLWQQVWRRTYELQNEHGLGELLAARTQ